MKTFEPGVLRAFSEAAFRAVGIAERDAVVATDTMVEANLRGVDSHGVRHLAGYVHGIQAGVINADPQVRVERESATVVVIDGDFGLGQVACASAMETAIAKAQEYGTGAVGIRNSNHSGMVGYYPMMAARAGCVGFTTSSGTRSNPPFGGVSPMLGGVFAYALPTGQPDDPLVLDTVCTTVRPSKLRELLAAGEPVPAGWALDREGRPTEDPVAAQDGFRQWMGGPRGYGLAVVWQVLAGVLPGGAVGLDLPGVESNWTPSPNTQAFGFERQTHYVSAVSVDAFIDRATFDATIDRFVAEVRASEPAPGVESVMLPGEPENRNRRRRVADGIPVPDPVVAELEALRAELGLSEPLDAEAG